MATWVIQSNRLAMSQTLPLIQALRHADCPFVDVGVGDDELLSEVPDGADLIPYGSTMLVNIALRLGWRHLWFDEASFRVDEWLRQHPCMLNADARVMPLSAAKDVAHEAPSWFIRPVNDLKTFAGHVIDSDELVAWVERLEVGDCEIDGSCVVAMSRQKAIQMEWRYFVVGGRIVTGSAYRHRGQPHRKRESDADVLVEAQALADLWLPHETCCMDIALCDGKPYVVEFNCLNASGFYDHDIAAFAAAVSSYSER